MQIRDSDMGIQRKSKVDNMKSIHEESSDEVKETSTSIEIGMRGVGVISNLQCPMS